MAGNQRDKLRLQTVTSSDCAPLRTAPAYNYGWSQHLTNPRARWEDIETELERNWDQLAGNGGLGWDEAYDTVRAGWEHVAPSRREH